MHQPAIGVGTCTSTSLLCSEQRPVRALQAERRPRAAEVWALQDMVLMLTQELELEQAACHRRSCGRSKYSRRPTKYRVPCAGLNSRVPQQMTLGVALSCAGLSSRQSCAPRQQRCRRCRTQCWC